MQVSRPLSIWQLFPFKSKLFKKFAAGFLLAIFFTSYQPQASFPPFKPNLVKAQESTQSATVAKASLPVQFQLPHPGYLSTHYSNYHPGIDIATGLGMPIKPIAKGTVTSAGLNFWGLGLVVEVSHEGGYKSLYAHMGRIYVNVGQTVDESSLLGEVGMTGNSSGPHTHLEITRDNQKQNPIALLPEIRKFPESSDFKLANSNPQPTPMGGAKNFFDAGNSQPTSQIPEATLKIEAPKQAVKKPELNLSLTTQKPEAPKELKNILNFK